MANHKELVNFAKSILDDSRLDVVIERMSLRYWDSFRTATTVRDREIISARQDVLEDFVGELQAVINESLEMQQNTGDSDGE